MGVCSKTVSGTAEIASPSARASCSQSRWIIALTNTLHAEAPLLCANTMAASKPAATGASAPAPCYSRSPGSDQQHELGLSASTAGRQSLGDHRTVYTVEVAGSNPAVPITTPDSHPVDRTRFSRASDGSWARFQAAFEVQSFDLVFGQ